MTLVQIVLLAIESIAQLVENPVFGLKEGGKVAALLALVAKFGRKGDEAIPELQAFTDEINQIIAAGGHVDPELWDELTARRHADLDRILDASDG